MSEGRLDASGTIEKAIEVLFHLHSEGHACGVTAIGRDLGLPKSTAHRIVTALGRRGLVERDEGGRYGPGSALVALGLGVLEHEPVVEAAAPVLEETALLVGETIFLASSRGRRLFVLDKREGSGFLRASPRVGAELPVHSTAIGKLYLALAPQLVECGELVAHTPQTIADPQQLEREIARTRERGFGWNYDEWIPGLAGVAAPVLVRRRLVAAVAISGPSSRFGPELRAGLIAQVQAAARAIGARLESGGFAEAMR